MDKKDKKDEEEQCDDWDSEFGEFIDEPNLEKEIDEDELEGWE